jgi:hypothetical protein
LGLEWLQVGLDRWIQFVDFAAYERAVLMMVPAGIRSLDHSLMLYILLSNRVTHLIFRFSVSIALE